MKAYISEKFYVIFDCAERVVNKIIIDIIQAYAMQIYLM